MSFSYATKNKLTSILKNFLLFIERQFNKKIKKMSSDNGLEFLGNDCQTLLQSQGIIHEKSCVYTPQQSGVVEIKHHYLLEIAIVLFQAAVPIHFWPYSILVAAFIMNRLPTVVLKWKSPYDVLYKKQPDYMRMKPFGCLAYAAKTLPNKSKFIPRASKCIFLGYVSGRKCYQLYDMDNERIILSRDVFFFFLEDLSFLYKAAK